MLSQNKALTMSSRDIAELTKSRHDSVKRSIERMEKSKVISFTPTVESNPRGGKPLTLYHVNKRDSYIVVAQLSPEFTAALVDRWQELEQGQQHQLPKTYADALQLAADQAKELELAAEKLEQADQEVQRLQGVCHNIAAQFSPGMTPAFFCRQLNGVNTQQVQGYLVKRGMLYRQKSNYRVSAYYRDKWFTERHETPKEGVTSTKVLLTRKGAISLYKLYLKSELPMKKDWDKNCSHYLFDQSE